MQSGYTVVIALGKPFSPVDHRDQHILGTAGLELVHHPQPELRPLGLLDPQPQHLLVAVAGDPDGQVHRLVAHQALVADLHPQRVEVHDRVDWLQGAVLPRRDVLEHRVGDGRDKRCGHPDAVQFLNVRLDVARAHPARVHGDDLLVETGKTALVLADQHRVESALTVPGNVQHDALAAGVDRLRDVPLR